MTDALTAAIRKELPELPLLEEEPLRKYTSFHIGGPAKRLLLPRSAEELLRLCCLLRQLGEKPLILGRGSNVLAPDGGIDGTVVVTARAQSMELRGAVLEAECGALLGRLAAFAADGDLAGLSFACGIPGTLGGALVMNAGAYGGEMADVTLETEFLDENLRLCSFREQEHGFGYRRSAFPAGSVILRARLKLSPGEGSVLREEMRGLLEKRSASQPLHLPSAGSAFKRPEGAYAAALIDQAGLKGLRVGGAQVSEKHAGFIVNTGDATAEDVKGLLALVQERVFAHSGYRLEPEIRIL